MAKKLIVIKVVAFLNNLDILDIFVVEYKKTEYVADTECTIMC